MHRLLLVVALVLASVACTGDPGADGDLSASDSGEVASLPEVPTEPGVVATVPFEASSLVVIVSSQSYDREEVGMRVEVDGLEVVDRTFESTMHAYVAFPLDLAAGLHQITIVADDGTRLDVPVDLPDGRRWLTLDYWSGGDHGTYIGHRLTDVAPQVA